MELKKETIIDLNKDTSNKTTIFDVAAYFLKINKDMCNVKLNIMCFYAQSMHLAVYNKPLFNEKFEAWEQGYICPALWYNYDKLRESLKEQ